MIVRFVEVTDGCGYGKFLVCRLDPTELAYPSAMPEAEGAALVSFSGRRLFAREQTMVIDLQRGAGFVWDLERGEYGMLDYLRGKHPGMESQVCWMYLPFVKWLYNQGHWAGGRGSLDDIPAYLELTGAQGSWTHDRVDPKDERIAELEEALEEASARCARPGR